MNDTHELDLSDDQWAFVLPLLPPGRVRHTPRGRARSDRVLFAVIALIMIREQPWSAAVDYGISAGTVQSRWSEWREAGVFARMVRAANGRTALGQWAWTVVRASEERAARAGIGPVTVPGLARPPEDEHRWAWRLQNAFPEGS